MSVSHKIQSKRIVGHEKCESDVFLPKMFRKSSKDPSVNNKYRRVSVISKYHPQRGSTGGFCDFVIVKMLK